MPIATPAEASRLPATAGTARPWAWVVVAVVFASAFLLFQVQPIMGRLMLPWFGGGAHVWLTTLLFFQAGLLAGYAYSHLLVMRLPPRWQGGVHAALLVGAALVLPVLPSPSLQPAPGEDPVLRLLLVLAVTVGPPYLLLTTTGPLLQRWFAGLFPGRSPYPLFALSNAGSLLALLSYPVVFEPLLGLRTQAWGWSGAYVLFALGAVAIAWRASRLTERVDAAEVVEAASAGPGAPDGTVTPARVALWLGLTATASAMLMATTDALTQDIASFPFLWVLPLALYLVTFVIAFAGDRYFDPRLWLILLAGALAYGVYLATDPLLSLTWAVPLHALVVFVVCLAMHGELARLRPAPSRLTGFYLAVAAGGALGGFAVAVLAPWLLTERFEYHAALVAAGTLAVVARAREYLAAQPAGRRRLPPPLLAAAGGVLVLAGLLALLAWARTEDSVARERSFYGVVDVYRDVDGSGRERLAMRHGRVLHGVQYLAPELAGRATIYYGTESGVGLAFLEHPGAREPLRVGVVGLGTGALSVYARPGERWTYLEIDPQVTRLAEAHFTYLADARARGVDVDVREGDGRLLLAADLDRGEQQGFDVLVLDAFTGGTIPTHLLTREAFEVYRAHLAPGGVLAVHISNRHLDLHPVIRGVSEDLGLHAVLREDDGSSALGGLTGTWALLAEDAAFVERPGVSALITPWHTEERLRWTDDRTPIWPLLGRPW
jgi:hypothetical protein